MRIECILPGTKIETDVKIIVKVRMQMLKSDISPRKTDQESVDGTLLFHHCSNQGSVKGHWWKIIKDPISAS